MAIPYIRNKGAYSLTKVMIIKNNCNGLKDTTKSKKYHETIMIIN